jgi:hypothetical protein
MVISNLDNFGIFANFLKNFHKLMTKKIFFIPLKIDLESPEKTVFKFDLIKEAKQ